ncbi:MAG: hypothetical protein RBR69_09730 [Candidatus Cloacimonadaceae bacterium]|nr:hypothetical protein [Candidatus Cloacimonadaceae bacterium]
MPVLTGTPRSDYPDKTFSWPFKARHTGLYLHIYDRLHRRTTISEPI